MSYKIDIKIILKEVEPFTTAISIMITVLKSLIKKNLITGYTIEVKE